MCFIAAMIPVITVILKLNVTIGVLNKQMETSQKDRKDIHEQLNDHETRISILENK